MLIRCEASRDRDAITALLIEAFADHPYSHQTEHLIVDALRLSNALTVSLVAEMEGQVVGHIAFSPVTIADGTPHWYGLGPVSVLPAYQRTGIGSALIREGLARLKELGAQGCCLVGHPAYYGRFGFQHVPGLGIEGVPAEAFFALSFTGPMPQGMVEFHPAFVADGSAVA